jgi:uncharacterized repeat protein (TIGR03803 family)
MLTLPRGDQESAKSVMTRLRARAFRRSTLVALMAACCFPAFAKTSTETTLYNFTGGSDGAQPNAGLIADAAGNLYGTTFAAGCAGEGNVFKLATNGTLTILHCFQGQGDGDAPVAELIVDATGNLYGTTEAGGAHGYGTVFMVAPDGTETVLHSFAGGNKDGKQPMGSLVLVNGTLYGATGYGGRANRGVIFQIAPDGTETVIVNLLQEGEPWAGLVADAAGNLYGTSYQGGRDYDGTVFKVSSTGTGKFKAKVLHSFNGKSGGSPRGTLILDTAGNLYGTSYFFGSRGVGNVFKLTMGGQYTELYSFAGGSDGWLPAGGVVADAAGNLYGTTSYGGIEDNGTVYKLATDGTETVLGGFAGGGRSFGSLTMDSALQSGYLYGTTSQGGVHGQGSIFSIKK